MVLVLIVGLGGEERSGKWRRENRGQEPTNKNDRGISFVTGAAITITILVQLQLSRTNCESLTRQIRCLVPCPDIWKLPGSVCTLSGNLSGFQYKSNIWPFVYQSFDFFLERISQSAFWYSFRQPLCRMPIALPTKWEQRKTEKVT